MANKKSKLIRFHCKICKLRRSQVVRIPECVMVMSLCNYETNDGDEFVCKYCWRKYEQQSMCDVIKKSKLFGLNGCDDIIMLIAEYCIGYIVKCGNYEKCNQQMLIGNKFEFIAKYKSTKNSYVVDISFLNKKYLDFVFNVYGEYRRFACSQCINYCKRFGVDGCRHSDIDSNGCYVVNFEVAISMTYYHNRLDGKCLNHYRCHVCKKIVNEMNFERCKLCEDVCCYDCIIQSIDDETKVCKDCDIMMQRKELQQAVYKVFDIEIADVIIRYTDIGCVVECCHEECQNEIYFADIKEFSDDWNFKCKYKPMINITNTVKIYGNHFRIFCIDCYHHQEPMEERLGRCIMEKCLNFEVLPKGNGQDTYCQDHEISLICIECNKQCSKDWICQQCGEHLHIECALKCTQCLMLLCGYCVDIYFCDICWNHNECNLCGLCNICQSCKCDVFYHQLFAELAKYDNHSVYKKTIKSYNLL